MLSDLNNEEAKLASYMSDISERCYYARWMENLELELWHAVINWPKKYGHDFITQIDIDYLTTQSQKTNAWITFQGAHEETSISLSEWKQVYENKT
jgi:hypothetical protein